MTEQAQTTAISVYPDIQKQLELVKVENEKIVFDYESEEGNKAARSQRKKLRGMKGAIEAKRKEMKAGILEQGRAIDGGAKTLIGQVQEMIDVHDIPLKEIEQREINRQERIEKSMFELQSHYNFVMTNMVESSAELQAAFEATADVEIGVDFAERMAEATNLQGGILRKLEGMIVKAKEREAEQARLAVLEKEAAERKQRQHDEQVAADARYKAQQEAAEASRIAAAKSAAKAKAAKMKAQREADARVQATKDEAAKQAAQAEAKRKAAEADEEAERQKAMAAQQAREASEKHCTEIRAKAGAAILKADGVTVGQAGAIVRLIADGKVPNITLKY